MYKIPVKYEPSSIILSGVERFYNWHNRCNILDKLFKPHNLEIKLAFELFGPYAFFYPEMPRPYRITYSEVAKDMIADKLDRLYGVPDCLAGRLRYIIINDLTTTKGGKM